MEKKEVNIYVDGSYNPNEHKIGCAVVLIDDESKRPHRIAYSKQLKSQKKYGSNIAELSATKTGVKTARSLGATKINIYHDWTGINIFSHGGNIKKRHSSCPSLAAYANFMEEIRKNTKITFIKVKAHSDNELNCLADRMARVGRTI